MIVVILILVIILLVYLHMRDTMKLNKMYRDSYSYLRKPNQSYDMIENNLNVDLDLGAICKSVSDDKKDSTKDSKEPEKESECVKEAKLKCPKEKSIADQLFEQKQVYNNLRLQCEDRSPSYRFLQNDRYIMDNTDTLQADEKLALKMIDSGDKAKKSLTYRAMYDKNSLVPYLEAELENAANSRWWEDDALEANF